MNKDLPFIFTMLALMLLPVEQHAQFFRLHENFLSSPQSIGISENVVVADIDLDADQDLILLMENGENLLMQNVGAGQYQGSNPFSQSFVNEAFADLAVADFDGDGDADFMFLRTHSSQHDLYFTEANGSYRHQALYVSEAGGQLVKTADWNGDELPDILIGRHGQNLLLINEGNGSFRDETRYRIPAREDQTNDLTLFDFDGDGDVDIFSSGAMRNRLLVNNGAGGFKDETLQRLPMVARLNTQAATISDVDNDGLPDLILATADEDGSQNAQNQLWLNVNGQYFFDATASRLPVLADQSYDVDVIDIDDDGDMDLAFADHGDTPVQIFVNDGDGFFEIVTADYLGDQQFGQACKIIVADLDGDRMDDLYVCLKAAADRILLRDLNESGTTSVTALQEMANSVNVFPNPVTDRFRLSLPANVEIVGALALTDMQGRQLMTLELESENATVYNVQLPRSVQAGMYFLTLPTAKGTIAKKLWVE